MRRRKNYSLERAGGVADGWFPPADVAAPVVVFFCSALSAATNGAALLVDGGVVRSPF